MCKYMLIAIIESLSFEKNGGCSGHRIFGKGLVGSAGFVGVDEDHLVLDAEHVLEEEDHILLEALLFVEGEGDL